MTTLGLKNVNLLSKEQYNEIDEPARDELWAIEAVESYTDDDGNWYRIYPDGWCEQGGVSSYTNNAETTITLLKPFTNNNYCVQTTSRTKWHWIANTSRTTTSFTYISKDTSNNVSGSMMWEAKGYIA